MTSCERKFRPRSQGGTCARKAAILPLPGQGKPQSDRRQSPGRRDGRNGANGIAPSDVTWPSSWNAASRAGLICPNPTVLATCPLDIGRTTSKAKSLPRPRARVRVSVRVRVCECVSVCKGRFRKSTDIHQDPGKLLTGLTAGGGVGRVCQDSW